MRFVVKTESNGWEHFNVLIDTQTGEEVFHDNMEPEDATLVRDLSVLVNIMNMLADEAAGEDI